MFRFSIILSRWLKKIKSGQFKGLVNLEKLFIDKNEIHEIELNSFEDMNKLILLNIQSSLKMSKRESKSLFFLI